MHAHAHEYVCVCVHRKMFKLRGSSNASNSTVNFTKNPQIMISDRTNRPSEHRNEILTKHQGHRDELTTILLKSGS